MSYKSVKELESHPPDERRNVYKEVEADLYRENRLFLAAQLIGGFFPGLAVLGFIEGYRRFDWVKENPIITGILIGIVVFGIWFWKDRYKDQRIADALAERVEAG